MDPGNPGLPMDETDSQAHSNTSERRSNQKSSNQPPENKRTYTRLFTNNFWFPETKETKKKRKGSKEHQHLPSLHGTPNSTQGIVTAETHAVVILKVDIIICFYSN